MKKKSAGVRRSEEQMIGRMAIDQSGRLGIIEGMDRSPATAGRRGTTVWIGKPVFGEGQWRSPSPRLIDPAEAQQVMEAFQMATHLVGEVRKRASLPAWRRKIVQALAA